MNEDSREVLIVMGMALLAIVTTVVLVCVQSGSSSCHCVKECCK